MKKKIMVIIAALFVITAAVATVGAAGRGKVGNPSAAVSGICDGVPAQDGTGMQYGKNENAGQGNGAGGCIYDGDCPNDGVPAQEYGMSFGRYKAYQELLKYYPDITPEECNELSMNEIKNLILESGGEWVGNSQNNSQCTNSTDETKGQNNGNSVKEENSGNGKGNGNKSGNQKGKN